MGPQPLHLFQGGLSSHGVSCLRLIQRLTLTGQPLTKPNSFPLICPDNHFQRPSKMEDAVAYETFCSAHGPCAYARCGNSPASFTIVYDRTTGVYTAVHGSFCSGNCAIYALSPPH